MVLTIGNDENPGVRTPKYAHLKCSYILSVLVISVL